MINWYVGWSLLLTAFVTGAAGGLYFHREDFLGGYTSFRRRIMRLGHIALAALGMINILFSLAPPASETSTHALVASAGFIVGGVTMPAVCFLTSWRIGFRYLFFIPVGSLLIAVVVTLWIGRP
jgi:hypothetical protein